MAILLTLNTDRWRLEIAGQMRELPAFLPALVDSLAAVAGTAELQLLDRGTGMLVPVASVSQTPPLFFENTVYDCYLTSSSGEA